MTKKERSEMMKRQWVEGKRSPTIPRTLPDRNCGVCGKLFRPRHSKRNRYCSKFCGDLSKRNGNEVACESCGKRVWRSNYSLRSRKNYYCSKVCADRGRSRLARKIFIGGSGNPLYRSGRRYEYKAVKELLADNFLFAMRSPGSKGVFDVWGLKIVEDDFLLKLIQVKGMKNTRTFNKAIPRKERAIMFKSIFQNNFKWWGRLRGIPKWAKMVHFEVWVYEKGRECHKFRLAWEPRAHEPKIISVDYGEPKAIEAERVEIYEEIDGG